MLNYGAVIVIALGSFILGAILTGELILYW